MLLGVIVVAVVAATAGVAGWLLARGDDSQATGPTDSSGATLATTGRELAQKAAPVGHVVYWVGPVQRRRYELTYTEDGRAYVRYLPPTVELGDSRPGFVTVGTYLLENAFTITRATSLRKDARRVKAPAGAIAFYTTARPQSVYLAYEGSDLQIEVYHPTPREARRLVETGEVRPVG